MDKLIKIGILTVSDRASKGEYEDLGGPSILNVMSDFIDGPFDHVSLRRNILRSRFQPTQDVVKGLSSPLHHVLIPLADG